MEIRLIFLSRVKVTVLRVCISLMVILVQVIKIQEIALTMKPVPQTDTGGLVEYTKALERTILKELGKLHL